MGVDLGADLLNRRDDAGNFLNEFLAVLKNAGDVVARDVGSELGNGGVECAGRGRACVHCGVEVRREERGRKLESELGEKRKDVVGGEQRFERLKRLGDLLRDGFECSGFACHD